MTEKTKKMDAINRIPNLFLKTHSWTFALPRMDGDSYDNKMSRIVIAKDPTEIHLLESQIQHVGNIERILLQSKFALDLSMLGAGKT
jgi:hypothetical protein